MDKKPSFTLAGVVLKPARDHVTTAIETIFEERRKIRYDAKEKWLRFVSDDLDFLKAVQARLKAITRKQYGLSRTCNVVLVVEDGVPVLYVHEQD